VTSGGELISEGDWTLITDPTSVIVAGELYGEAITIGGGGASTKYNIYYWSSSSSWVLTDADAAGTSKGLIAMSMESAFNSGMLLRGYANNAGWGWTPGDTLYLSTTAGGITNTQPTGTGDIVRVVGYAISARLIYFNPSQDWIELL
jgi:hypothetical protein